MPFAFSSLTILHIPPPAVNRALRPPPGQTCPLPDLTPSFRESQRNLEDSCRSLLVFSVIPRLFAGRLVAVIGRDRRWKINGGGRKGKKAHPRRASTVLWKTGGASSGRWLTSVPVQHQLQGRKSQCNLHAGPRRPAAPVTDGSRARRARTSIRNPSRATR